MVDFLTLKQHFKFLKHTKSNYSNSKYINMSSKEYYLTITAVAIRNMTA